MLLSTVGLICFIYLPTILSHTPASLRALATIHNQRARAVANALNLRALTHYNLARARALREHRVVRDSKKNAQDILEENTFDPEVNLENPYQEENFPGTETLDNGEFFAQRRRGFDFHPDYLCMVEELNKADPEGDFLNTPLDLNVEIDGINGNQEGTHITGEINPNLSSYSQVITSPPEGNDGNEVSYDPVARTELTSAELKGQELHPSPNTSPLTQNVPNQEVLGASFIIRDPNIDSTEQQFSMFAPITLLDGDSNEEFTEDDVQINSGGISDEDDALEENSDDFLARSAHLHPFGHGHTHTHSFTHFSGLHPLHQNLQVPTAQVPGVNIHLNQNQNSVGPQVFPAASVQPGLLNSGVVYPGGHGFGFVQPGVGFSSNLNPSFGVAGLKAGTSASQTQTVNTQVVPNAPLFVSKLGGTTLHQNQAIQTHGNNFVTPNIGGNSATQSQTITQGGVVRKAVEEIAQENVTEPSKVNEDHLKENPDNERLGSFKDIFYMKAPESPKYFDPNEPRNLKPVVNYIESHQGNINKILHTIQNTRHPYRDNLVGDINNQSDKEHKIIPGVTRASGQRNDVSHSSGQINPENEKVGTFNLADIHMEPLPNLPGNFEELNPESQRQSIIQYLEAEQKNVHNILEQIDESYHHNMDSISNFVHNDFKHQQQVDQPPQEVNDPNYKLVGTSKDAAEDKEIFDTLTKLIQNDPGVHGTVGMGPDKNSNLGYIFHVPERRYSEYYQRLARSTNEATMAKLDKLLMEEKKLINELKKDAKHDEDLMMIGYIGDSLIEDLEKRMEKTKRGKRAISSRGHNLPFTSMVTDPKTKFNVPKTLDNLGTVAKEAFEHERAPLYHVRNALGSAQNAMIAALKIPTKNFLIPCDYDIVNTQGGDAKVGDINPSIYRNQGGPDGKMDTFQKMGFAIRESVQSGKEALTHVTNAANHARSAFRSTAHMTPRLILKPIPVALREPKQKATLITPRIFDISQERDVLGKPQTDYVRLGDIFDAVGVSNPNMNNVEFEKITIDPQRHLSMSLPNSHRIPKPSNVLQNFLETVRIEDVKNLEDQEDFVGNTLESLENARETVGASSLKDFFTKMKHNLEQLLQSRNVERKTKRKKVINTDETKTKTKNREKGSAQLETLVGAPHNSLNKSEQQSQTNTDRLKNQPGSDQEVVGAGLWPEGILKPFMGQATKTQREQFMKENKNDDRDVVLGMNQRQTDSPREHTDSHRGHTDHKNRDVALGMDQRETDKHLGQILGAINPMMFERLFNESLPKGSGKVSPHSVFHHHHNGRSHGHHRTDDSEEDQVGTSMTMQGQILKPFMGQASVKAKQDFFDKYTPESTTERFYIEDVSQELHNEYKKPPVEEGESEENALEYGQ